MNSLGPAGDQDVHEVVQSFDADVVEYVVIALPDLSGVAGIASELGRLVEESWIRILDLVAIKAGEDGATTVVQPGCSVDLAPLDAVEGETGGLLGQDDIALAGEALPPDSAALLLVIEDSWAARLAAVVRSSHGRIVGGERISRRRLQGLVGLTRERSEHAHGGGTAS